MKHLAFIYFTLAVSLLRQGSCSTALAKKARDLAEEGYNDAQGVEDGLQNSNQGARQGSNVFLSMSSQHVQQAQSSELMMRFSEAVERNSQALIALEAEQEQLSQREAAFESRML